MTPSTDAQPAPGDNNDVDEFALDNIPTDLESTALACRDAGLLFPPVPVELTGIWRERGPFDFGSDASDPTDVEAWLRDARDLSSPAGVSFSHTGHGVNAWRLNYRLILPSLAVHLGCPFGGIYGDRVAEARAFNLWVERLEELIVLTEVAARSGKLPAGVRLLVQAFGGGGGWALSHEAALHDSTQPFDDALKALSGAR